MAKIVYNSCYGGFGLSDAAIRRYAELKGLPLISKPSSYGDGVIWLLPGDEWFEPEDIVRHDHCLVQVVEELGINAYGLHARLDILDVPNGIRYNIDEYDGMETVILERDMVWLVAE